MLRVLCFRCRHVGGVFLNRRGAGKEGMSVCRLEGREGQSCRDLRSFVPTFFCLPAFHEHPGKPKYSNEMSISADPSPPAPSFAPAPPAALLFWCRRLCAVLSMGVAPPPPRAGEQGSGRSYRQRARRDARDRRRRSRQGGNDGGAQRAWSFAAAVVYFSHRGFWQCRRRRGRRAGRGGRTGPKPSSGRGLRHQGAAGAEHGRGRQPREGAAGILHQARSWRCVFCLVDSSLLEAERARGPGQARGD